MKLTAFNPFWGPEESNLILNFWKRFEENKNKLSLANLLQYEPYFPVENGSKLSFLLSVKAMCVNN